VHIVGFIIRRRDSPSSPVTIYVTGYFHISFTKHYSFMRHYTVQLLNIHQLLDES